MKLKKSMVLLIAAMVMLPSCNKSVKNSEGTGSSGFSPTAKRLQIAFLTNGPANDWGYNYSHNQGRLMVQKDFKSKVRTGILENIPETADAERVMERLINAGVKVIVATSFGYQDATMAVARQHPDIKFLQAWGYKRAPNVGTYSADMYQSWYLVGIVAGRMTKSNKLGIVAAYPVPPMKWQINAFLLGARSVNPKVTASVTFINHWYDAVLSAQATDALVNQGSDVVCGVLDNSVGVAQEAEKRGVWFIGHNADLTKFAPTRDLVGTEWLWGKLYEDEIRKILDGTWTGGSDLSGGLKQGYVGITPFSKDVPPDVQKEVLDARNEIVSGKLAVYKGPLKDNTGKLRVPVGKTLAPQEVMAMDWLVEGVH